MASMEEHPVLGVLRDMERTVASKAHDYADNTDVYSNFRGAAKVANVSEEQVFQTLIGIKVERLRQLTSGKEPNHEGIEDTLLDLANYAALWLGFRREQETWVSRQLQFALDTKDEPCYTREDDIIGVPV